MWQLAALMIAVGSANLASELDDALTDPRAAWRDWRALWFVGVGMIWTVKFRKLGMRTLPEGAVC